MPKHFGGLGIRNIVVANQVLLLKWMWQWYYVDNRWWKFATVMDNSTVRPWDDPHASPFWKDLARISPIFDCSVTYRVRDGANVRFRHDTWCSSPLKYTFPNLYCLASEKHCSVQYCIMNETWQSMDLSSHLAASLEREALLLNLQNLHLTQVHDTIQWSRDSTVFSCSSAYRFLTQTPAPSSYIANLWLIKAPLRVLVFAWLLLQNRLTTTDNLMRRGWNLPSICVMRAMDEETAHHIFQTCRLAGQIRSYVRSTFQPQYPLIVPSAAANCTHLLMDPDTPMIVRQIELTTCFVLWRERCRRIFSDKFQSPISLIREIRLEYAAWFVADSRAYDPE